MYRREHVTVAVDARFLFLSFSPWTLEFVSNPFEENRSSPPRQHCRLFKKKVD